MFYKIVLSDDTEESLIVSNDFKEKYMNETTKSINICAGQKRQNVKVQISPSLDINTLEISKKVLDYLFIPLDVFYQISINSDCIKIGPVIGLLIAKKSSDLTKPRLKRQLLYAMQYEKFGGLVYVFSWEGINFSDKIIKGYYFKYDNCTNSGFWKEGILPLPDVVYNRTILDKPKTQQLKGSINYKLFNSLRFNKLYFYNITKNSKSVRNNIPDTRLFSSIKDLDEMLEKYDYVYLKPVGSSLAKGIIRVNKLEGNYCFQANDNPYPVVVNSEETAFNYYSRIKCNQQYLVQQGINSIKIENRYIDFRVIMQKDETLDWKCTAIVAKVGKENGICSNFKTEGYAISFEEAFMKALKLNIYEIHNIKNKLINTCRNVCKVLDKTDENFGDVGIDAAIDNKLNIWILEVNTRHDHNIVLCIKDKKTFYTIKSNAIKYAVSLSGFCIKDIHLHD